MENKLEQLLNSLIEKGWKPFGKDKKFDIWIECLPYKKIRVCLKKPDYDYYVYSYRDIVSAESGLWQFVCENGMCTAGERPHRGKFYEELFPDYEAQTYANNMIIESALCDEDKLEEFLLSNIKIDG